MALKRIFKFYVRPLQPPDPTVPCCPTQGLRVALNVPEQGTAVAVLLLRRRWRLCAADLLCILQNARPSGGPVRAQEQEKARKRPANGAPAAAAKSMTSKLTRAMSRSGSAGGGPSAAGLWEARPAPPAEPLRCSPRRAAAREPASSGRGARPRRRGCRGARAAA